MIRFAFPAALLMCVAYTASAQQAAHGLHPKGSASQSKMAPQMEMCKQMMADMEREKAHMKEMDAILDRLTSTMDSATGYSKIEAMAVILKELVAQRRMARMMKEEMDGKMMGHMMGHMKMPMKSGKMDCPMMKSMGAMGGK